jgi:hypothetical protein
MVALSAILKALAALPPEQLEAVVAIIDRQLGEPN